MALAASSPILFAKSSRRLPDTRLGGPRDLPLYHEQNKKTIGLAAPKVPGSSKTQ